MSSKSELDNEETISNCSKNSTFQRTNSVLGVRGESPTSNYVKENYQKFIKSYLPHDPKGTNDIENLTLQGKKMKVKSVSSSGLRKAASRMSFVRKITNNRRLSTSNFTVQKNFSEFSNFSDFDEEKKEEPLKNYCTLSANYMVIITNPNKVEYFCVEVENLGNKDFNFTWKKRNKYLQNLGKIVIQKKENDSKKHEEEKKNSEEYFVGEEKYNKISRKDSSVLKKPKKWEDIFEEEEETSKLEEIARKEKEREEIEKEQEIQKKLITLSNERSKEKFFYPFERKGLIKAGDSKQFYFGFLSQEEGVCRNKKIFYSKFLKLINIFFLNFLNKILKSFKRYMLLNIILKPIQNPILKRIYS